MVIKKISPRTESNISSESSNEELSDQDSEKEDEILMVGLNESEVDVQSPSTSKIQDFKETVFCNNSNKHANPSSIVLMKKVPTVSEYSNGHDQSGKSTTSGQSLPPSSVGKKVGPKPENSVESNPVGALQELCIARNYPFPIYIFSDENLGKPNVKFTAKCFLSNYKSSGTGVTKQGAKKEAADKMYKQIEKLTSKDSICFIGNEREHKNKTSIDASYLCHESVTLLKTFFDKKSVPKTDLLNIKKNLSEFKRTAYDTFRKILQMEYLTFDCFIISKNSDEVEVMVQVNTFPVLVFSKSGKNESDARESAALVILTYFKSKCYI
ncbi:hypothetical protein ACI65C_006366 [Semiaphis heraclei]